MLVGAKAEAVGLSLTTLQVPSQVLQMQGRMQPPCAGPAAWLCFTAMVQGVCPLALCLSAGRPPLCYTVGPPCLDVLASWLWAHRSVCDNESRVLQQTRRPAAALNHQPPGPILAIWLACPRTHNPGVPHGRSPSPNWQLCCQPSHSCRTSIPSPLHPLPVAWMLFLIANARGPAF